MLNKSNPGALGVSVAAMVLCWAVFVFAAGDSQPPDETASSRQDKIKEAKHYYLAGEQYLREGNYAAADEALKKAQALLGGVSPVVIMDDLREQPSLQKESSQKETWPAKKAWRFSAQGKSNEAIREYMLAIEEEPKNADLYYNLGVEFLKVSQFHKALRAFQEVARLKPRDKDAYYNIGVLLEGYLDDKKGAVEAYGKYLKLAPKADDSLQVKQWIEEIRKTSGAQ